MTVDLDRLAAAHAAATPGPMAAYGCAVQLPRRMPPNDLIASCDSEADAVLYALAHNELPALIAELRQLRAERDRLRTSLERAERDLHLIALHGRMPYDIQRAVVGVKDNCRAALGGEHE